jgi:uncharacterized integral membrane protein
LADLPIPEQPQRQRSSWKLWVLSVAGLLLAILVVQNSQDVPIDFLFVDVETPLIFALLIAGVLGFLIGWLAPIVRRDRKRSTEA